MTDNSFAYLNDTIYYNPCTNICYGVHLDLLSGVEWEEIHLFRELKQGSLSNYQFFKTELLE